jgi:hypothetical protein
MEEGTWVDKGTCSQEEKADWRKADFFQPLSFSDCWWSGHRIISHFNGNRGDTDCWLQSVRLGIKETG